MTETYADPRVAVLKKISALRAKLVALDWTPDKVLKLGASGPGTPYNSINQIKASLAPHLSEVGLEFKVNMSEPKLVDPNSRQWLEHLVVSFIDIDTAEQEDYDAWGFGIGEKGVGIATSYALKSMLGANFCIADGADPEKDAPVFSATPGYKMTSGKEKLHALEQVSNASTTSITAATPVPKAPAPKPPMPKPPVASAPDSVPVAEGKPISPMQKKAIGRIVEATPALKEAADALTTADEAYKFINENKVL